MKIHQLRNATFIIESGSNHILVDPMLSEKGNLPTFTVGGVDLIEFITFDAGVTWLGTPQTNFI